MKKTAHKLMTGFLKIYAYICINALFLLSMCASLDLVEKGFAQPLLTNKVFYFTISLIPLIAWQIVNYLFFAKPTKLYVFRNFNHSWIKGFGLFFLTLTLLSVLRDCYFLIEKSESIKPFGIIGQYFNFVFKPNIFSSSLTLWLYFRYFLIICTILPYIINIRHFISWKQNIDHQSSVKSSSSSREDKQNNDYHKKFPHRKLHRKKLHYIE